MVRLGQQRSQVVMEYLEREIETVNPPLRDTAIIDGMFLLRSLEKQLPYNLRGLVRVILMKTMKMSRQRSDLVFDTYNSPSLKDIARSERGDEDSIDPYTFGSGQKTPNNFRELLKLSSFKNCFLRFFYGEIRSQDYANIIVHHELFCSVDSECIKLTCDEKGYLVHENYLDLYGNHDEADTRVAFHAHHASQNGSKNIVVRCNDTDILIIFLMNSQYFQNCHVWIDIGLDSDNSRWYIDNTNESKKLDYLYALPGVYTITGCDYIPAFFNKGKMKAIQLIKENSAYRNAFAKLGYEDLTNEVMETIEKFICCLFGYTKLSDINQARCRHFETKCKPKSASKPMDYIKSVEPTLFPPCKAVIIEQTKRAWYVPRFHKGAYRYDPTFGFTPIDFGWQLNNGNKIEIKWFEGEQVPTELEESNDNDDDETDDDDITDEEDEDEYILDNELPL